jgi:Fe-S-cluster containining protein
MKCKKCGKCCFLLHIDFRQVDYDDKWVEARGGIRKGMHVYVPLGCKWLSKDNLCSRHNDKPLFCREFPKNVGPQAWLLNMGCKYYG